MTASRREPLKPKFVAVIFAALFAAVPVFWTLSPGYNNAVLKSAMVFAGDLRQATLTRHVRLSESVVLAPGAEFRILPPDAPADGENKQGPQRGASQDLKLTNATITLEQASALIPSESPDGSNANANDGDLAAELIKTIKFKTLHIEGLALKLRSPGGRLREIGRITAEIVNAPDSGGTLRISGKYSRQGRVLDFKAALAPGSENGGEHALKLNVDEDDLKLALSGTLATQNGLTLTADDAQLRTSNLKKILDWFEIGTIDNQGFADFSVAGNLTWTGTSIAFDQAQFGMDGNRAGGRLSINFNPPKPAVEGSLAFQSLQLLPYFGKSELLGASHAWNRAWSGTQKTANEKQLPLGLHQLNADLRLSARSVRFGETVLGKGAAVLISRQGKLAVDFVDVELANGIKGRAHVQIDVNDFLPSYLLRGDLQHMDLGGVSGHWLGQPVVDGIADVTFDLAAEGRDDSALLKSLSGPIVLAAQNGASIPVDLIKLFRQSERTPNSGWKAYQGGFTALKDLSVEVVSSRGALTAESVKARIGSDAVTARGTLKLTDLVVDLVLTRLAIDAPDNASDNDVLELKGTILQPVIRAREKSKNG